MIIAFIIDLLVNLFIIFFLLRLTVDEREFFFNPVLQPVYRATEPVLRLFQGARSVFERQRWMPIVLIILLLVILRGVILKVISIRVLVHSILSVQMVFFMEPGIRLAIVLSIMNFIDFLFQIIVVFLISDFLLPPHSTNAICRFIRTVVDPLLRLSGRLFTYFRKGLPLAVVILVLIAHILVTGLLLTFFVASSTSGLSSILFFESASPSVEGMGSSMSSPSSGLLRMPAIAFSSIALVLSCFSFFTLVLIVGALMSWIRPDPFNPLVQWIELISAPILFPFRRIIPLVGGLDLSPIAAILAIELSREGFSTIFQHLFLGFM